MGLRNRLVMTYAPLVKYIVYKKVRELPARCEVEDFISCGLEALIASIDRYDPDKGATLEQYAWTRIHGAVLDELRRQDWAPRSLRRWERDINKAREQFTAVHGRRPDEDELADALATTVDDLRQREHEIQASEITSLNTLVISEDDTTIERMDTGRRPAPARARDPGLRDHVAEHALDLRGRHDDRAHGHAGLDGSGLRPRARDRQGRGQGQVPPRLRAAAAAGA